MAFVKKFGVDIAMRRTDDLDTLCLEAIAECNTPTALDIGCGAGGQSIRMVEAGAQVTAIDIVDYEAVFVELRNTNELSAQQLLFIQGDVVNIDNILSDTKFDFVMVQRIIHYLPYATAVTVLQYIRSITIDTLFISVTGLESDIGRTYVHKNIPIAERFTTLEPEEQETFSITEPVCLYTEDEFKTLLTDAGWMVEKMWSSAFKNHKAVCKPI